MIQVDHRQRVCHITLDRPAKRNALTMRMCQDIVAAVSSAEERDDIGCILFTANGSAFCAGMDLGESSPVDELTVIHEQLFTLGARARKPIIVAVNGPALAGGLGLAAQGHIVIASPNATFGLPEIRIGFWPFVVYRAIESAVGKRRALELSLTGAPFTAEQACAWGFVQQIQSEPNQDAAQLAQIVAEASPLAMELGLRYVREAEGKSSREAGGIAAALRAQLIASPDYTQRTAAYKKHVEGASVPPDNDENPQRFGRDA
jgi:enoyl-CoA hydratase/carnithine racemase